MQRALQILTSRRYPEGAICEIIYQIPGTACYVVDVHCDNLHNAYATESEISDYNPDAGYEYEHD